MVVAIFTAAFVVSVFGWEGICQMKIAEGWFS